MPMTLYKLSGRNLTRAILITLGLIVISILRAGSALHYSAWNVDEEFVVQFAAGFLDYDLDPHWFGYHTLPMYIIAALYAVIYSFYELTGLVHSKVEFASLLFEHDAVFFASARLFVSFVHTLGAFVLALIVKRYYRSTFGAVVVFAAVIFLRDSVVAANWIRVDNFVFLFLCLLILFSCYAEKNRRNFFFSIIACAAAIASKIPAAVLLPALLVALAIDIRQGHYAKAYLTYAIVGVPILTLVFMPYALLDFENYKVTLHQMTERATGTYVGHHVEKSYFQGAFAKLGHLFRLIAEQVGILSLAATTLAGLYAFARHDRRLGLTLLFALAYTGTFATSASVDSYWLRPVYPIYIFLAVVVVIEISRDGRWTALLGTIYQRFGISGRTTRLGTHAPLALLAIYFAILAQPAAASYYHYLTDTREDTRVLASRWIPEHLPEGSLVIEDTFLPHYLPRVFSPDPYETFTNFDYRFARHNKLLSDGYAYYFKKHLTTERLFRLKHIYSQNLEFDPRKIRFTRGAYIIVSSGNYLRFESPQALINNPMLTKRALGYYASIRRLELIKKFGGKGPTIEIYRVPSGG